MPAFTLVLIGTLGLSFALQGRFHRSRPLDLLLRIGLAAISGATVFHPVASVAALYAGPTLLLTLAGTWRFRTLAR